MTDTLRSYGYGTGLLISGFGGQIKRVTAIGSGLEDGQPICDYVDQQGQTGWCWDSQIREVIE